MKNPENAEKVQKLILWPGIFLLLLQWLVRFGLPAVFSNLSEVGILGGMLFGAAIIIWWAFFSKAPKPERWGGSLLMVIMIILSFRFLDESISTAMQGMMFFFNSIPIFCLALVAWAVLTRNLTGKARVISLSATIFISFAFWTLLRTDGMSGDAKNDFHWRWSLTAEEKLLLQEQKQNPGISALSIDFEKAPEWPGFRGAERDGIIQGIQIETNWKEFPPVELWRHPVGPGCSSFAVWGEFIYTQEQRGDFEMISCYDLNTGKAVWMHQDSARFWDSHAGAGPRATPTLEKGRVYCMGATGILNVLDASDGSLVWSTNAAEDTHAVIPGWGISASPLVVNEVLVVAVNSRLAGYDINSGELLWNTSEGGESYSSPHLVELDGIPQVLFLNGRGANSYIPRSGKLLWNIPWSGGPITQPALSKEGDLLLGDGSMEQNLYRFSAQLEGSNWETKERWMTNRLKPYFYDLIIHKDHAYGFFGPNITCIEIENGTRKWKGNRCSGFAVLLADQDLLLILSEKGEIILTEANPGEFNELFRMKALDGKTWSHPVVVGNKLLVRNNVEMAAYSLALLE